MRSADGNARGSVAIGFSAIRTTMSCPSVMPPSVPPALFVARAHGLSGRHCDSGRITSWIFDPVVRVAANPAPISTPLTL